MKWIVFSIEGEVAFRADGSESIDIQSVIDHLREWGKGEVTDTRLEEGNEDGPHSWSMKC